MLQIAEVQAGATGAATAFPVILIGTADGQPFTTATEANVEVRYCREGETAWTLLDDAVADNILADGGAAFGRYLQRTIAAPMAAAAGVGYVDFVFSGTGFFTQHVRVYLRAYDWRSAPASESGIATATATAVDAQLADNFSAIPAAVEAQLANEFAAIPAAVATELAGAGGAAARTAIATAVQALVQGIAWGATGQPAGGSTVTMEYRTGVGAPTQRKRFFYDSTGRPVGATALEAIP